MIVPFRVDLSPNRYGSRKCVCYSLCPPDDRRASKSLNRPIDFEAYESEVVSISTELTSPVYECSTDNDKTDNSADYQNSG